MIKKFNEFIKEGFMTRTLNRKNDTDKRLEDVTFFDKNKKYIDLFLKKNGVESYKDLMEDSRTKTYLELSGGWFVEDFNLVMIIIGKLMEMYPQKKLTGKFACNPKTHWSGYDFDVTNRLSLLKISGQISKGTIDQIGWSDDSSSSRQFQHKLKNNPTYRKFTEDEYYEAFDFMIDNFSKICDRYIEFDEYVREGFMTRSLDRNNSNYRKEDESFFKSDDVIELKKMEGWFISGLNGKTYIYRYPRKKPIASFTDFVITGKGQGTYYYENLKMEPGSTKEDEITIRSEEFRESIADYFIPF